MAKKIRHLFDTAVCPTLVRDTETSLSKLEAQTREADKDAGRPAGWSQRWGKLAVDSYAHYAHYALTHSLTHPFTSPPSLTREHTLHCSREPGH